MEIFPIQIFKNAKDTYEFTWTYLFGTQYFRLQNSLRLGVSRDCFKISRYHKIVVIHYMRSHFEGEVLSPIIISLLSCQKSCPFYYSFAKAKDQCFLNETREAVFCAKESLDANLRQALDITLPCHLMFIRVFATQTWYKKLWEYLILGRAWRVSNMVKQQKLT